MWIKKTPREIEETVSKEANKPLSSGRWVAYTLLGVFLMIPVFFNVGRLSWRPGPFVRPMDDVMQRLPGMVLIWLIAVIFMQFFKVPVFKRKLVVICPKCEAAKNDDGDYQCRCDGHFVDIRTMKWVEDEKS